jgi:hypothetical protein
VLYKPCPSLVQGRYEGDGRCSIVFVQACPSMRHSLGRTAPTLEGRGLSKRVGMISPYISFPSRNASFFESKLIAPCRQADLSNSAHRGATSSREPQAVVILTSRRSDNSWRGGAPLRAPGKKGWSIGYIKEGPRATVQTFLRVPAHSPPPTC